MKRKKTSSEVDAEPALKRTRTALFDNGMSRIAAVRCPSFPKAVSRIVGDYSPDSERECVMSALVGLQPITLCLSQNSHSNLACCWRLGFLRPAYKFQLDEVKIDKQFPIMDVEGCLSFLDQTNSTFCRIDINILVVKLSMSSSDSPSALDDLRITICALQKHLSNVKHVVISITDYASCCFTFKDSINNAKGSVLFFDRYEALRQIINDLDACWSANHTLSPNDMFDFYFESKGKPASEKFLAKFVISLNHPLGQTLFKQVAFHTVSHKIMWVFSLKSEADFHFVDQDTTRLCHAIDVDMSTINEMRTQVPGDRMKSIFCYRDNRFVERIVINSCDYGRPLQLPRSIAPLTDSTPFSALRELTLIGENNVLDLGELNSGYFPQLTYLSVFGAHITGQLDSYHVPLLKSLHLRPGAFIRPFASELNIFAYRHIESVLRSGCPWQLVASRRTGGWSLASYDMPITHSQEETKEDSFHCASYSQPLIRELLLFVSCQENVDEWQVRLSGDPSLDAIAANHTDRLLLWKPQCVQNITAFSPVDSFRKPRFNFRQAMPEQTRILYSLTCYNIELALDGTALPHLQSLDMSGEAYLHLSGTFPRLKTLSVKDAYLRLPWELDAPLLESLSCQSFRDGHNLTLDPQLLPQLSFLQIRPHFMDKYFYPNIINIDSDRGLSRINHVVFDKGMTLSPFFEECRVNRVSHLELAVDVSKLPTNWNTVWYCETLNISVSEYSFKFHDEGREPIMFSLPALPQVKTLTVTRNMCGVVGEEKWHMVLDSEMPELTDCTLPSPKYLGENLKCPALRCIRFTGYLLESEKKQCLDRATYSALGAQPSLIYFDYHDKVHKMTWDIAPNESKALPLVGPLKEYDDSSVYHE